jgi:hypothetical protein
MMMMLLLLEYNLEKIAYDDDFPLKIEMRLFRLPIFCGNGLSCGIAGGGGKLFCVPGRL